MSIAQLLQSDWCHLHSGSATLLCIKIPAHYGKLAGQVIKPGTGTPERNEMERNGTEVQAHLKLKSNPN